MHHKGVMPSWTLCLIHSNSSPVSYFFVQLSSYHVTASLRGSLMPPLSSGLWTFVSWPAPPLHPGTGAYFQIVFPISQERLIIKRWLGLALATVFHFTRSCFFGYVLCVERLPILLKCWWGCVEFAHPIPTMEYTNQSQDFSH